VSLTVARSVYTRVDICIYARTRGLYRIKGQQITLISTKHSYRFLAGEERRVQGCAYARLKVVKDRLLHLRIYLLRIFEACFTFDKKICFSLLVLPSFNIKWNSSKKINNCFLLCLKSLSAFLKSLLSYYKHVCIKFYFIALFNIIIYLILYNIL